MSNPKEKKKPQEAEAPATPEEAAPAAPPAEETVGKEVEKAPELSPEEKAAAELKKTQDELAEAKQNYLYLQAEFQNYRRRCAKDISDARILGTASALEPFLRVNDFLGMAKSAAEKSDNIESIRQGILMIIGEYEKAMDEFGVVRFKSVGEKFDPSLHDAVKSEHSETTEEGIILSEYAPGYKMGERLLRPARVVVSLGKEPERAPAPEKAEEPAPQQAPHPEKEA